MTWRFDVERQALLPGSRLLRRLHRVFHGTPAMDVDVSGRQSGAIPYRIVDGKPRFLLVTSRGTGRWIFPKGGIAKSLGPLKSAAREAFEEAGVLGAVESEPVGAYRCWKFAGFRRSALEVDMYLLKVERELDDWPEKSQRRRDWAPAEVAARRLSDPGLREIIHRVDARLRTCRESV